MDLILVTVLLGLAAAQTDLTEPSEAFTLPPKLQIREEEVKQVEEKAVNAFKEKCEANGGESVFNATQTALTNFVPCLKSLVDPDQLQQEIDEAKPEGRVDEVFKKYCDRAPQFKSCFRNLTETAKPCFAPDERKHFKTLYNVTDQLAEFICFKDGDRIALFIAEGGPECFKDRSSQLQECVNKTMGSGNNFSVDNVTLAAVPNVTFSEQDCNKMFELEECVNLVLEQCEKPTTANIVESMFKFIQKSTPCKAFLRPSEKLKKGNAADILTASIPTFLSTLAVAILSLS